MRKLFAIEGMHCSACSSSIERVISRIDGVNFVNVSLLGKHMTVDYDETKVNDDLIIEKVHKAGFIASLNFNKNESKIKAELELKKKKKLLLISIALLIPLLIISMGGMMYIRFANLVNVSLFVLIQISLELCLIIPIILINFGYYKRGFYNLFKLHPNMDSLVSLGSIVSLIYGLVEYVFVIIYFINKNNEAAYALSMEIYLESSASVLCFVSIGKYLESKATKETSSYMESLLSMNAKVAHLRKDNSYEDIDPLLLNAGDEVLVKTGETVPADGVVIEGNGSVNEAALTGESLPIYKEKGSEVIAGSINYEGTFTIKVSKVGDESTINKIAKLIDDAAASKGKLARIADKISLFFTPAIILIAIITFVVWFIISKDVRTSFRFAICVLLISCPCALGLATPVAVMAGCGRGAENGILIKSAQAFEELSKVNLIVFDKTGTITEGKMKVNGFRAKNDEENILREAASLELNSSHPISNAIIEFVKDKNISFEIDSNFKNIPGVGIEGKDISIINLKAVKDKNIPFEDFNDDIERLSEQGNSILFIIKNNAVLGYFAVGDQIKENAKETFNFLKEENIKTCLLSGDASSTCSYVANILNINDVKADCLPADKIVYLNEHKTSYNVAFVGDGVNDAPCLKSAIVCIAIGAGTSIAIDCADIVLINSKLSDVNEAIGLSKRVSKTIKENLLWAFIYNIILIPIAAGCFYKLNIVLNPTFASIAMCLSSIMVVLNALRIKFWKK